MIHHAWAPTNVPEKQNCHRPQARLARWPFRQQPPCHTEWYSGEEYSRDYLGKREHVSGVMWSQDMTLTTALTNTTHLRCSPHSPGSRATGGWPRLAMRCAPCIRHALGQLVIDRHSSQLLVSGRASPPRVASIRP